MRPEDLIVLCSTSVFVVSLLASVRFYVQRGKVRIRSEWISDIFFGASLVMHVGLVSLLIYKASAEIRLRRQLAPEVDEELVLRAVHRPKFLKVCLPSIIRMERAAIYLFFLKENGIVDPVRRRRLVQQHPVLGQGCLHRLLLGPVREGQAVVHVDPQVHYRLHRRHSDCLDDAGHPVVPANQPQLDVGHARLQSVCCAQLAGGWLASHLFAHHHRPRQFVPTSTPPPPPSLLPLFLPILSPMQRYEAGGMMHEVWHGIVRLTEGLV